MNSISVSALNTEAIRALIAIGVTWGDTVNEGKLEAAGFPLPAHPLTVHSRLDHPDFKKLMRCMRQVKGHDFDSQVSQIQDCVAYWIKLMTH